MPFYEKGAVRIHYEDTGSGFPLFIIPGGGLNSTIAGLRESRTPFDPIATFKGEYRCIAADLRNALTGQSTGPLEVDRPWDCHADDQLALMDHLGIKKFMVMGFCIGGPFIWNLLKRAPDRVAAAVLPLNTMLTVPEITAQIAQATPVLCVRAEGASEQHGAALSALPFTTE